MVWTLAFPLSFVEEGTAKMTPAESIYWGRGLITELRPTVLAKVGMVSSSSLGEEKMSVVMCHVAMLILVEFLKCGGWHQDDIGMESIYPNIFVCRTVGRVCTGILILYSIVLIEELTFSSFQQLEAFRCAPTYVLLYLINDMLVT